MYVSTGPFHEPSLKLMVVPAQMKLVLFENAAIGAHTALGAPVVPVAVRLAEDHRLLLPEMDELSAAFILAA